MMNNTKHICLVSGGKDSQATAIWCLKNDIKPMFLFCDTEWEDEVTYQFIKDFEVKLGVEIMRLTSMGFVELAKKKKRFPSTKAKFCTEELKIKPTIDYILTLQTNVIIYQGIRWQESTNRAGMNKSDEYFKFYFEPYSHDKKGKPKFHTYRKKEIKKWLETYTCDVERPIISWTTKDVFEYIIDNGFMANKLYQYGFTRVGCFPCIMCTKDEIAKIDEYRPGKIDYIKKLEEELNSTFFPPDYLPKRYCSKKVEVTDKETGEIRIVAVPTMSDVIKYVKGKRYGSGLFAGSHCQNQMLPCE
jgi:3'-phosphoadenosine 5'-phosphosulfate sulfotransferase (PAPS reductase)/FAD synthetase